MAYLLFMAQKVNISEHFWMEGGGKKSVLEGADGVRDKLSCSGLLGRGVTSSGELLFRLDLQGAFPPPSR